MLPSCYPLALIDHRHQALELEVEVGSVLESGAEFGVLGFEAEFGVLGFEAGSVLESAAGSVLGSGSGLRHQLLAWHFCHSTSASAILQCIGLSRQ